MKHHKDNARVALLLLSALAVWCCTGKHQTAGKKHYDEDTFSRAHTMISRSGREAAKKYIDSVYAHFPVISLKDRHRYYQFMVRLYEEDYRPGNEQKNGLPVSGADSMVMYADSALGLIEKNRLQKEMAEEYAFDLKRKGEQLSVGNTGQTENFNKAARYFFLSREVSRSTGDSCECGKTTNYLAITNFKKKDYIQAIAFFKEEIRLLFYCKRGNDQFHPLQGAYNNIAFSYQKVGKIDSAEFYYFKAIEYIQANKSLMGNNRLPDDALFVVYENLFQLYMSAKNIRAAELYLDKCDSINNNVLHDSLWAARVQLRKGELSISKGDYLLFAKKLPAIEQGIPAIENDPNYRVSWYKLFRDISHAKGDINNELLYERLYYELKYSLTAEADDVVNPAGEFEKMQKQIEVARLEKKSRAQKTMRLYIITIAAFIILLIMVIYLQQSARRKRLAEEEEMKARKLEEDLFLQTLKIHNERNEAVQMERSNISENLHDELSSSLAALKYYVEDIKAKITDSESKKIINDIAGEVASIYKEARSYMHRLKYSAQTEGHDIVRFLDDIRNKFDERGLLAVRFDIDREKVQEYLDAGQHEQLYNFIKEAISNVIKHADADKADIRIAFENNLCRFMIRDNGKGFDKEEAGRGIGLGSMQRRIKKIGGMVSIRSDKTGTELSGSFPLKKERDVVF